MFSPQLSHEVKAAEVSVMHFDNKPSEVHKAGCAHAAKAERVFPAESGPEFVRLRTEVYVDDYYYVAPCARKAG